MLLQSILQTTGLLIPQIFILNMKYLLSHIEGLSFEQRVDYLKTCYPDYSQGSSRAVIPMCDKYVLKIAYNIKGVLQNEIEHTVYSEIPVYYKRFLAKIKKVSPTYSWIIQERVEVEDCWVKRLFPQSFLDIMCDHFNLCIGDLDQNGKVGNRFKIYDYGLSHKLFHTHYT